MAFPCTCYKSLSNQQTVSSLHRPTWLGFLSRKNSVMGQGCCNQLKLPILHSPHLSLRPVHHGRDHPFLIFLAPFSTSASSFHVPVDLTPSARPHSSLRSFSSSLTTWITFIFSSLYTLPHFFPSQSLLGSKNKKLLAFDKLRGREIRVLTQCDS